MPRKADIEESPENRDNVEETVVPEISFKDSRAAINGMINQLGQLASPFIKKGVVQAVMVIAVSSDGTYAGSHVIEKNSSSGESKDELEKDNRVRGGARLQLMLELRKQLTLIEQQLINLIK